jgi:hypothetical protein
VFVLVPPVPAKCQGSKTSFVLRNVSVVLRRGGFVFEESVEGRVCLSSPSSSEMPDLQV